jgi:hypothetical protein
MNVLPHEVVPEYFRCVREKDAEGIDQFFADDVLRISFQGQAAVGHAAVVDWYVNRDFHNDYVWHLPDGSEQRPAAKDGPPYGHLTPLGSVVEGNRCVAEIDVELADGTRYRALDMFTLDDTGRVSQLLVYRGPRVPAPSELVQQPS